jgi:hypothetical protein
LERRERRSKIGMERDYSAMPLLRSTVEAPAYLGDPNAVATGISDGKIGAFSEVPGNIWKILVEEGAVVAAKDISSEAPSSVRPAVSFCFSPPYSTPAGVSWRWGRGVCRGYPAAAACRTGAGLSANVIGGTT